MHSETVTVTLDLPQDKAFRFMASIENLPIWATEFCLNLEEVDGRYYVDAPDGRLIYEIHADESTGVVDIKTGPTEDQLLTLPARVIPLPRGKSAFMVTVPQAPGVDDDQFQIQLGGMRREVAALPSVIA